MLIKGLGALSKYWGTLIIVPGSTRNLRLRIPMLKNKLLALKLNKFSVKVFILYLAI